jgi:3-hydroxy-9,10-secoandrosta-1,3,5(10)-triene-9,17-dione monooxygenase reductase component
MAQGWQARREVDADMEKIATNPEWFRQVLGRYPTGVCAVTGVMPTGELAAMVVGSFTSVSLDPPLVAFLPARSSSSWVKLRQCVSLCINVLSIEQESVCRRLASRDPDKMAGLSHRRSPSGSPIIDGVVAWIDCAYESIHQAGDHDIAICAVAHLDIEQGESPLVFLEGGYGAFAAPSFVRAETGN